MPIFVELGAPTEAIFRESKLPAVIVEETNVVVPVAAPQPSPSIILVPAIVGVLETTLSKTRVLVPAFVE